MSETEASASAGGFEQTVLGFVRQMKDDRSLHSRVRRCSAISEVLLVPQVHKLHVELGADASAKGAARIALLVSDADLDKGNVGWPLGEWLARAWEVNKAARPSKDWKTGCERRLDALLRTSDPDMFVRLLRAMAARLDGKVPFAAAAQAVLEWERPSHRRNSAMRIACEYAVATGY